MERDNRISSYLPRLGLTSLILCLISGIILSFQYRPMGNVFQNVEEMTTLIPYGRFFRQLHYGAGELFVILMLLHTIDHFLRKRYKNYPFKTWSLLLISLFLCFFGLFTGFVLKGDKEGVLAGQVFLNILRQMVVVGDYLGRLFIVPGDSFFFLPYLYHCFFIPLLLIFLIRDHIREWMPDRKFVFSVTAGLFLFALLFYPPIDIPPEAVVASVKGPWFFLGIQSLLRIFPPFWAGLILPGLFMGLLLVVPHLKGVWGKIIHYVILASCALYVVLSIREYVIRA